MRVAVIGAGIGGLAVANGLARAGAEVVVYERAASVSAGGVALSLFANGLRALDRLGVGDRVRALGGERRFPVPEGVRDERGRWLTRFGADVAATAYVVRREALHEALHADVADVVRCGSAVTEVEGGAVVLAEGRRDDDFDLIVAADGLRSVVRRSWPDDPGVQYSGYHAWRGATDRPVPVDGHGEVWGRGVRFGLAPLTDDTVYWFATVNGDRRRPPPGTPQAVIDAVGDWAVDDVRRVLTASETAQCLPIEELRPGLTSMARGRVALLGDAAHAMTPNLGQGANQALEDAAQLTELVRDLGTVRHPDEHDVAAALRTYDGVRRPRAQRVAAQARRIGRAGQLERPVACGMRNLLIRVTPDHVTDRGAKQMQAWDVDAPSENALRRETA